MLPLPHVCSSLSWIQGGTNTRTGTDYLPPVEPDKPRRKIDQNLYLKIYRESVVLIILPATNGINKAFGIRLNYRSPISKWVYTWAENISRLTFYFNP
jgi:hypothetical protein